MNHKIKDFEKGLIAACLQDHKIVERAIMAKIKPKHFKDRDCRIIFEIITSLSKEGSEVNTKTISMTTSLRTDIEDRHKDVIKSKVKSYSSDTVDIAEFSIKTMIEKRRITDITSSIGEVVDRIHDGVASADDLEAELSLLMKSLSSKGDTIDLGEYNTLDSFRERVTERNLMAKAMEDGGTGYFRLAGYLNVFADYFPQGFPPQTITTIAGMTNVGKSHMMNAFAYMSILPENACNTLYIISENRRIETESRLDAIMSGEAASEIAKGNPSDIHEKIFKRQKKHGWGRLFTCKVTVGKFDKLTIEAAMDFIHENYGAKVNVLVIDSPDHMTPVGLGDRAMGWERKAGVYNDIKSLADTYNLPVITSVPSQAATEGKADVSSANVAGSYDIARLVDNMIMFLHSPQDELLNRRRLKVTKLRGAAMDGRIISLRLKEDLTYTEWRELDETTDEQMNDDGTESTYISKFRRAGFAVTRGDEEIDYQD